MNAKASDRNLLLGILALQMDFITRDALVEAMHQWTLEKSRTLSDILVGRGALDQDDRDLMERMVDRHIKRHGGDARQSLGALDLGTTERSVLDPIGDPDVRESLSTISQLPTTQPIDNGPAATVHGSSRGPGAAGRFQILSLIDEGGLGSVFLARDGELNREVALKQIKEQMANHKQSRARFVLEAEITGNLEHPGVVPVYGKGEYDDGRPYYAMQFIRGENLKVAADRFHHDPRLAKDAGERRAEFQKLLRRFLTACETMAYAHSRGVIHRDLKPRNILLGPFGETLVVDWGLAKVVGHEEQVPAADLTLRPPSSSSIEATIAGTRLGTAAYMSPEQARGEVERIGPASDIYGLGATLYYLLTGRAPFEGDDQLELMLKVEQGEFRPPRELSPKLDRALNAICCKAMALNPKDRYDSARALSDDLERWLSDQPVEAYPEPILTRANRWMRRHRRLAGSVAALVVVTLLAVAYHDVSVSRAESNARDQLRITLESLRYMLELCGVSLAHLPNTERLREDVARRGLAVCQQLGRNFPNDRGVQLETSQVYRVIAGIERITGRLQGSRRASDQAITILTKLCDSSPGDPETRSWLVEALVDRGSTLSMQGKTVDSERDFASAIAEAERLKAHSAEDLYLRGKGMALINLSEMYLGRDQAEEALNAAENAIKLLSPLAEPATPLPRTPTDRWLMTIALIDRASAHKTKEDNAAALADLKVAESLANRILSENADYSDAKFQLARLWTLRSEWLADNPSELAEAERTLDKAIETLRGFVKSSPSIPFFREQLAGSLTTLARLRIRLGQSRYKDVLADCEEARKLAQDLVRSKREPTSSNPNHLSILGQAHEAESLVHDQMGQRAEKKKSLVAAQDVIRQALEIDNSRAGDRRLLADILNRLNEDRD
jgi:serine/threonine-protein kinase